MVLRFQNTLLGQEIKRAVPSFLGLDLKRRELYGHFARLCLGNRSE